VFSNESSQHFSPASGRPDSGGEISLDTAAHGCVRYIAARRVRNVGF